MLTGFNSIYKCNHCRQQIAEAYLNNGSDYKHFSDGKEIGQMLPEFPELTRCPQCKAYIWLDDLEKIGEYFVMDGFKKQWPNAKKARFLNIEGYFEAIDIGMIRRKEDELFIRKKIWHAYNDRERQKKKMFKNSEDEYFWRTNNYRLIDLLDTEAEENFQERMMIAELYRNLGEFEESLSILQTIENSSFKTELINACKKSKKGVMVDAIITSY